MLDLRCADKGDDVDELSATTSIRCTRNDPLVERMCEYFNHFHRVATRYDKTSAHLLVVRPAYGQLRMAQKWRQNLLPA